MSREYCYSYLVDFLEANLPEIAEASGFDVAEVAGDAAALGKIVREHFEAEAGDTSPFVCCDGCGIPIRDPGENPDPAALLCDTCEAR